MASNTQNHLVVGLCQLVQRLKLVLSKVPNRVGVSLPSPEDGKRSSFRNVFSTYFEFRTMDKSHKPGDSELSGVLLCLQEPE
jgi:hypothetical protein